MRYELLDTKYIENYTKSYLEAVSSNREIDCFIGNQIEYRMTSRKSAITSLTDPAVLLEYCVYPLYVAGDKEIGNRIRNIMNRLANCNRVIEIYQVVKFIYTQDKLLKRYEELPIVVDVRDIVAPVLHKVDMLSKEMKEYKEGEFALYSKSIYDMIQGMIKKSKSLNMLR